jgi:alpha-D-ribose 1-methylphosphonate 5-triphosphate synthase subunit PhnG
MPDILYVEEKLLQATDELIAGKGSIRDRLISAAGYLTHLKIAEIPDKNRAEFAAVMDALTKHPAKREGEGSIRASVRKLHKEEPAALARKIMSLYVDVSCAARHSSMV